MKRDDSVYLHHILDAITRIDMYLYGVDEEAFHATPLIQDGAIRQLEIIGEATKQLSKQLRTENSHVPWRDMARMRDKLIHDYLGVDLDIVWLTSQEDLPVLRREVQIILETLSSSA